MKTNIETILKTLTSYNDEFKLKVKYSNKSESPTILLDVSVLPLIWYHVILIVNSLN